MQLSDKNTAYCKYNPAFSQQSESLMHETIRIGEYNDNAF